MNIFEIAIFIGLIFVIIYLFVIDRLTYMTIFEKATFIGLIFVIIYSVVSLAGVLSILHLFFSTLHT